jgi:hypothetical protein
MHHKHHDCILKGDRKTNMNLFFHHNFIDRRRICLYCTSSLPHHWFLLSTWSCEILSFHLKEELHSFLSMYSNCLCHYSCTLPHDWIKQKHFGTMILNVMTKVAVKWHGRVWYTAWIHWAKQWFIFSDTHSGMAWKFITLHRMACNLKLTGYLFLEFLILIFLDHSWM